MFTIVFLNEINICCSNACVNVNHAAPRLQRKGLSSKSQYDVRKELLCQSPLYGQTDSCHMRGGRVS